MASSKPNIDSLLNELDKVLLNKDVYVKSKQVRIDSLTSMARVSGLPDEVTFDIKEKLVAEYKAFMYDSTLTYALKTLGLAVRMGDKERINRTRINISSILTIGGMYKESIENINAIDHKTLSDELLVDYYKCQEQIYLHLSRYAENSSFVEGYRMMSRLYLDSLYNHVTPTHASYMSIKARKIKGDGDYRAAKNMLEEYLEGVEFGSHQYAISTSILSDICSYIEDGHEEMEKYLILSAMSDIISAVKENESLNRLAMVRFEKGDISRAYHYSSESMGDADFYDARLRKIEATKTLPIIEKTYRIELEKQHEKLRKYAALITSLSLLLIIALCVMYIQMRTIKKTRHGIMEANRELNELNSSLLESNHLKEEYIGHFMSLCSSYISKLERYQKMVNHKLANGKVAELRAMTRSTDLIDYEIKEFYNTFDKIFLKLYPGFIESFYGLLREEERVYPKKDELLTTELRIFALIRLGIQDSSQISKFLRYSANTVYTYRTKVKNKAKNRKDFESDIMKIGLY